MNSAQATLFLKRSAWLCVVGLVLGLMRSGRCDDQIERWKPNRREISGNSRIRYRVPAEASWEGILVCADVKCSRLLDGLAPSKPMLSIKRLSSTLVLLPCKQNIAAQRTVGRNR